MNKILCRIVLLVTVLCLIATALVGCRKTVEASDDIAFAHFLQGSYTVFDRGQTVHLQVIAVNEGHDIAYQGASAGHLISATLVIRQNGETYRINAEEEAIPTDATERVWEKGEQATHSFSFVIPADAPIGHYSLEVCASNAEDTIADVLEVHIHTDGSSHLPNVGGGDGHDHSH